MIAPTLLRLTTTLVASAVFVSMAQASPETITFPSSDRVTITGDLYLASENKQTPFILLFHQADSSRGEYSEIAPKLAAEGFNCLAIDQRSGGTNQGIDNATLKSAEAAGVRTGFPDALPDLLAAAKYARNNHAEGPIIAWGSSYSAALVLKLAGDYPSGFAGVLAFSPGEYFGSFGMSERWIQTSAKNITAPAFVTSAKNEEPQWRPIFDAIPATTVKTSYLPPTKGQHGSKALWAEFPDHEGYWDAVMQFLEQWKPAPVASTY
ncbi:MAG: alpha/beta hydrolase [Verrucomicrobiales bacterium]|nr:alpha/beta hydrolase [Verrucomicrobiales bacterium]